MTVHQNLEIGLAVYLDIIIGIDSDAGHLPEDFKDIRVAGLRVFGDIVGQLGAVTLDELARLDDDKVIELGDIRTDRIGLFGRLGCRHI